MPKNNDGKGGKAEDKSGDKVSPKEFQRDSFFAEINPITQQAGLAVMPNAGESTIINIVPIPPKANVPPMDMHTLQQHLQTNLDAVAQQQPGVHASMLRVTGRSGGGLQIQYAGQGDALEVASNLNMIGSLLANSTEKHLQKNGIDTSNLPSMAPHNAERSAKAQGGHSPSAAAAAAAQSQHHLSAASAALHASKIERGRPRSNAVTGVTPADIAAAAAARPPSPLEGAREEDFSKTPAHVGAPKQESPYASTADVLKEMKRLRGQGVATDDNSTPTVSPDSSPKTPRNNDKGRG